MTMHSAQYSPWQTSSTLQRFLSTIGVSSLVLPLIECTVCTWYTVTWCVTVVILATFMICFTLQRGKTSLLTLQQTISNFRTYNMRGLNSINCWAIIYIWVQKFSPWTPELLTVRRKSLWLKFWLVNSFHTKL